ncbi:MAG: hypothetical protein R6V30_08865 [Paracoccaceae bacterium]
MANSTFTTVTQKIALDQVRDVHVSETVDDGAGGYVRSVKFFGEPVTESAPALVFEVLLSSDTKSDLDITTPELSF